jgi:membrane protease YdiL (CAAX protease family)
VNEPLAILMYALVGGVGSASMITLGFLIKRQSDGEQLLAYEPRRPVPWNFVAPGLVLCYLGAGLMQGAAPADPAATQPESAVTAEAIWVQAGSFLLLTGVCLAGLAAIFQATAMDLGLPQSWAQFRRDVRIGAVAFLAVLAPVYVLQIILTKALESEQVHPLIEQLQVEHSPAVLMAAAAAVILGAPAFEETAFRLIFQGWLERRVDFALGWRKRVEGPTVGPMTVEGKAADLCQEGSEPLPIAAAITDDAQPPHIGALPGRPYGWAPVLVSGVAFAIAHLGHGVAPVSLFPLGVALGYIYQRTHRITPSIVCHGLFNGLSILMLWIELSLTQTPAGQ